jgi:putative transposase
MPRKPRFHLPGVPVHAIQRGHNSSAVFFADLDYLEYLRCLKRAADRCGCAVHAYVLMTNHVHLLLTPEDAGATGRLFQDLGRHYVRHINQTYRRRGGLWEGRYKASIIESQTYLLACMRYIEMNPVRAAIVDHPAKYRWSSYIANAHGTSNAILTATTDYLALGAAPDERQYAYRGLFEAGVDLDELALFRGAVQTGTPLGIEKFKAEIEFALGRRVGFAQRGRPRKEVSL